MARTPIHPGEILREEFLVPLKLTPYAVAAALHVPRTRIERIARERYNMALPGERLFSIVPPPSATTTTTVPVGTLQLPAAP